MLVISAPMVIPVTGHDFYRPFPALREMICIYPTEVVLSTESRKIKELYNSLIPVVRAYFDESQVFEFKTRGLHVGSPIPQWFPDFAPSSLTYAFQMLQRRCLKMRYFLFPIKVNRKSLVEGRSWNLDDTLYLVRMAFDRKVGFELLASDDSYISFGWDGDIYLGSHYDLSATVELANIAGLNVSINEPYLPHLDS